MPALSAPDAKSKVCNRPDVEQFSPVFLLNVYWLLSLYDVVNIMRVALGVWSRCDTSPCSTCDTGVQLVRCECCSVCCQLTRLSGRVQSRSLQRSVVTTEFMDEAAAAEVLHLTCGLLMCSCSDMGKLNSAICWLSEIWGKPPEIQIKQECIRIIFQNDQF